MEALLAERDRLRDAHRQISKAVKAERRRQRQAAAAGTPDMSLRCPVTLATAEALFHTPGAGREAALEFFRLSRRAKGSNDLKELPAAIFEQWAAKSPADIAAHMGTDANPSPPRRKAVAFLQERGLRDWVREQNVQKACAPMLAAVRLAARRSGALRTPAAPHEAAVAPGSTDAESQRTWLRRWADRWGVKRGRFGASSRLEPAAAIRKACRGGQRQKSSHRSLFWSQFPGRQAARHWRLSYLVATVPGPLGGRRFRTPFSHAPRTSKRGARLLDMDQLPAAPMPCAHASRPFKHGRNVSAALDASGAWLRRETIFVVQTRFRLPTGRGLAGATARVLVLLGRHRGRLRCPGALATSHH